MNHRQFTYSNNSSLGPLANCLLAPTAIEDVLMIAESTVSLSESSIACWSSNSMFLWFIQGMEYMLENRLLRFKWIVREWTQAGVVVLSEFGTWQ